MNHENELDRQTKEVKKLQERVEVFEKDVKTLAFLCHYLRGFANPAVGPVADQSFESFNVAFSELMRRYHIPPYR